MWIEAMCQPAAVDIESFEDLQNGLRLDAPVLGPDNDVEVFLAGFQAIENAIKQNGVVVELTLEEAEVAAVEFHPEAFTLKVFHPARPQVTPPVILHPATDGRLAQIAARLLALNPFETLSLLLAIGIDTTLFHDCDLCSRTNLAAPLLHSQLAQSLGFHIKF
jgi:hypothetical protein